MLRSWVIWQYSLVAVRIWAKVQDDVAAVKSLNQSKKAFQYRLDYKMLSSYLVIFVVIFGAAVICVTNLDGLSGLVDTLGLFQKSLRASNGAEPASGAKSATGGAKSARRQRRQSTDIGDESQNPYEVRSSRYTP